MTQTFVGVMVTSEDDGAIGELERLRASGAKSIVFRRHNLSWFEQYPDFDDYLRTRARLRREFRTVSSQPELLVFASTAESTTR